MTKATTLELLLDPTSWPSTLPTTLPTIWPTHDDVHHHGNVTSFCNLHHHHEVAKFVIPLILSSLGIVFTIVSIILSSLNTAIDPSLRGILVSYSTANFIGTLILTFDILVTVCYDSDVKLGVIITISIFLTLFHIMFLLLAEYQILTTVAKHSIASFSGLIVVSWIISCCIGSVFLVTSDNCSEHCIRSRILFVACFIAVITILVISFVCIIKKSKRRVRFINRYERRYLDVNNFRSKLVKRYWKLKYFAIILVSYVACATPWIVKQIHGGTFTVHRLHQKFLGDSVVLMVYLSNFYVPSGIIVYLWYKKIKAEKLMIKLIEFAKQAGVTNRADGRSRPYTQINLTRLKRSATRRAALRRNISSPTNDSGSESEYFASGWEIDGDTWRKDGANPASGNRKMHDIQRQVSKRWESAIVRIHYLRRHHGTAVAEKRENVKEDEENPMDDLNVEQIIGKDEIEDTEERRAPLGAVYMEGLIQP